MGVGSRRLMSVIGAGIILSLAPWATAQADKPAPQRPKEEKPKAAPAPAPQPPEGDELPNLDELLGIKKDSAARSAEGASKADLKRRLDARELGDEFHQAVTLMGDAAGRLTRAKDVGTTTQRIQEDIVRKLDLLIEQIEQQSQSAQQQQQQSTGEDSGSSASRQQRRGQRNQPGQNDNNAEMDPPPRQDGTLRPDLDSARAAWGALPERVRQMLLQGKSDHFSEAYRKLTEAYYRKLAEEGKK